MFKRVLLILANFLISMLASLMLPSKKGQLSPQKIKRILVYGQMGIGNMIMFTPFLKALRNYFPDSRIILLFLKKNGAEQVVEGSNLADEIMIWDYEDLTYLQRLKAILRMKRWGPDLLVTRFAILPVDLALITLLGRVPFRLGHVTSGGWRGKNDYIFNYPVRMGENEHEIDRNLHLANDVGIPTVDKTPFFCISSEDERSARLFLMANGIRDGEHFVTIQLGTNPIQSWKRWHTEKWGRLTQSLLQNNVKVVAAGSPDERSMIEAAFAGLAIRPVITAGKLSLKQTAALIKRSSLLVCNDCGIMHVAVAMRTPVVAISGPGDCSRTAPWGKQHIVIRKDLPCSPCVAMKGTAKVEACQNRVCLKLISVEEVMEAIQRQLRMPLAGEKQFAQKH